MAIIAYALPILAGQSERAAHFGADLSPELHRRYEELNREQNVRRHIEWVQPTPMGDLLIVVFETDTPERMGRRFEDNAYDRWWRERVGQIHGFDPASPPPGAIPAMTWHWTEDMS